MPRYLRWVWLAMAIVSILGLVFLWRLPSEWEVERRMVIEAEAPVVFDLLVDLDRWPQWSPWQESDYEELEFVYEGPRRGVGAAYTWNSEVTGDGRLEIVEARSPDRLVFRLSMQDGKIRTTDTLSITPREGGGVAVDWVDRGELLSTLLGKLSIPVIEASMGRDLETGLERLRVAAESPAPDEELRSPSE